VQRFQVEPAESAREEPFIARNIEATRFALGMDEVTPRTFEYDPALTSEEVEGSLNTVENVRLLDPGIVDDTFQELQGFRGFYSFRDIDVDRYMIEGRPTQVVLSARELRSEGLPNRSWESENVAFTHGYGLAVAPANEVDSQGEPRFMVGDIPAINVTEEPNLDLENPGLYFGEGLGGYAVVGAERDEVNYEGDADTRGLTRYIDEGGTGGVEVSGTGLQGFARRAAFALRFGEPNLLISGQVKDTSRILYVRDVRQRAAKVAPFLNLDSDPYPVILDGRVTWVLDGYTTTTRFPYAQRADTVSLEDGSGLRGDFNYVRNSVKVAIDAIDGDVTYWVIDPDDPLIAAYRKIFPTLFSDNPPPELVEHFRYPEDLFRVQTNMWGRYRLGDPSQFYDGGAAWDVSQDPGTRIAETTTETVEDEEGVLREVQSRIDPQYLLLKLPGDDAESFLLFRPFVPVRQEGEGNTASQARRNLTGFMVARSDPENYGKLEVFDVSSAVGAVRGPVQFDAEAQANAEIARQISLLNQQGSQVEAGNLLLIPIENSLVYVRPLYVAAAGGNVRFPRLQQVIVGVGDRVEMRPTFEEALDAVVPGLALSAEAETPTTPELPSEGETPGTDDGETPSGEPELPADVLDLLGQARLAFERADAALASGDLADYADAVDEARALLLQAELRLREIQGLPPPAAEGTTPPTTAPAATTEPEGGAASEA
jgi:uncharacterized membrane protein (UPF0182 family)